jgi:hypothetical protein
LLPSTRIASTLLERRAFFTRLANAATAAVFIDLVIALTMVAVWMIHDAAQRGATVLPYLLLMPFLGSMGPLIYLIGRFRDGAENRCASILDPAKPRRLRPSVRKVAPGGAIRGEGLQLHSTSLRHCHGTS